MTTYGFDMSWIDTPSTTNKSSNKVRLRTGSVYAFRQSYRGQVSSTELNAFAGSVGENIKSTQSNWATYTQPILNSLAAGNSDTRWDLPKEVDAFTYGLQGSTLLVFNDATSSKADGRYWNTTTLRPKTIAESLEDLYETVAGMETTVTASSSAFDDTALWTAVGISYETTVKDSLDTRATSLEGYISQLDNDIFEAPSDTIDYSYGLGTPLLYSVAHNIDLLLKAHGIAAGWQASPVALSHDDLAVTAENLDINDGIIEDVDSFNPSTDGSVVWHYQITDDLVNHQSGLIFAVWDDSVGTVEYSKTSTSDIGDTSDVVLSVDMSGALGLVRLRALPTGSSNWKVRVERMSVVTGV